MAESKKNGRKATEVTKILKGRLESARGRITELEAGAQRAIEGLVEKGRASRKDLEQRLLKLAKDERVAEVLGRVEKLQRTGAVRAVEWRGKAETFRADAFERLAEFQGRAISFLGVASREQVEALHQELDRLARKLEKREKARRDGAGAEG